MLILNPTIIVEWCTVPSSETPILKQAIVVACSAVLLIILFVCLLWRAFDFASSWGRMRAAMVRNHSTFADRRVPWTGGLVSWVFPALGRSHNISQLPIHQVYRSTQPAAQSIPLAATESVAPASQRTDPT
ncbi:hypothetical protein K474DRAFT_1202676 [Panus rudis PR-1116 ss-1]|nr:hypothetical protein K474DRAFT_1202676 [Panus rudis PR-1116 ss-1]